MTGADVCGSVGARSWVAAVWTVSAPTERGCWCSRRYLQMGKGRQLVLRATLLCCLPRLGEVDTFKAVMSK